MALNLREQIQEIKERGNMSAVIYGGPEGLSGSDVKENDVIEFDVAYNFMVKRKIKCFIGAATLAVFDDKFEFFPTSKLFLIFEGHIQVDGTPVWGIYGLETEVGVLVWNDPMDEN